MGVSASQQRWVGTTYGLTKALSRSNVSVTFVLPKRLNDLHHDFLRIVFANVRNVKFRNIKTLLHPYINAELYDEYLRTALDHEIYGLNLFDEVRRYGLQARIIAAEEDHDVIHAHDWLSFRAGIEAKRVSGKPLIVHVHATEFDRTGNPINIFMMSAVACMLQIASLRFLAYKECQPKHYDVDPDKITVVHNGIDYADHRHLSPSRP